AVLLVDDAHGFGTLGTAGRGTLEHFGLWERANRGLEPTGLTVLVTGTLSKALGGFGGILPGSTALLRAVQRANAAHAGASALPAPVAAAGARALQVLGAAPQLRSALQHNAHYVRQGLRGLGLPVDDLPTPVVGFTWRDAAAMRGLHRALLQAGSFVPYLDDYAGVGPDGAMRVAVCATHTTVQIDRLLTRLTASLRG
ncbi:MAG: pyridoxal phosphate-dependent aminotransferase family protein, partial [Planctomycetes bacterium]|nr:pyridoxal phosphate-dependent aminotransferase family protein [Planctomycetota bacterium]